MSLQVGPLIGHKIYWLKIKRIIIVRELFRAWGGWILTTPESTWSRIILHFICILLDHLQQCTWVLLTWTKWPKVDKSEQCGFLLHPFWNHWWSLQSDRLSAVKFMNELHYFCFIGKLINIDWLTSFMGIFCFCFCFLSCEVMERQILKRFDFVPRVLIYVRYLKGGGLF